MRVLLVGPASPGFVYPLIRIGLELQRRGHECWCCTGATFKKLILERGFHFLGDGVVNFDPRDWAETEANVGQVRMIVGCGANFDVVLGHQLSPGSIIAARMLGVPIVVLGLAAYMWPKATARSPWDSREQNEWRLRSMVDALNFARQGLGLDLVDEGEARDHPLLGDLFLLQSIPALEGAEGLPTKVRMIGACLWTPYHSYLRIRGFVDAALDQRKAIIYAQIGRAFGEQDLLADLITALPDSAVLLADSGRSDRPATMMAERVLVAPYMPQTEILPFTDLMISHGHSSSVLGAATHGVPMLLLPNGSGTEVISARCAERDIAEVLWSNHEPSNLSAAISRGIDSPSRRAASAHIAAQFRLFDAAQRAADAVESVFLGTPTAPTPMSRDPLSESS